MEQHDSSSDSSEIPVIVPRHVELLDPENKAEQRTEAGGGGPQIPSVGFLGKFLLRFLHSQMVKKERFAVDAVHTPNSIRTRYRLAGFLFIATCLSTFFVGGIVYAAAVMLILFAHEMGHYLQALRYGVPASLPYFIPMPLTLLGTMGAVIVQGGGVADRKQMFDIAISGPLAGLLFALPFAYFGLYDAQTHIASPPNGGIVFGDPLIMKWMIAAVHGPIPEGKELVIGPLYFAGWVGILITALNLIPVGQLDGGHILYCLLGKRAHAVAVAILGAATVYMVATSNYSYILMVILLCFMGARHPPTSDDTAPLGAFRVVLGWLTLAFIIVGFTLMPISV